MLLRNTEILNLNLKTMLNIYIWNVSQKCVTLPVEIFYIFIDKKNTF